MENDNNNPATDNAMTAIDRAQALASANQHEYVTIEHLLLALIEQEDVQTLFNKMGVDFVKISEDLISYLKTGPFPIVGKFISPKPTLIVQETISRAVASSVLSSRGPVTPVDLLVHMTNISPDDSFAIALLLQYEISSLTLKKFLSHGTKENEGSEINSKEEAETFIEQYAKNLNNSAIDSKIDPLIGRTNEVDTIIQIIARRTKNNAIMVGEPGVGKAQPLFSKVLTAEGFRNMGDLKIGDMIVTPNGDLAPISGIFPQGIKSIYNVEFKDGQSTHCCDEHLWKVYRKNWRRSGDGTGYRILSLSEICSTWSKQKTSIPLGKGYKNANIIVPLDPYILGVLIGDGCIRGGRVDISTSDTEILENIKFRLIGGYELSHRDRYDYRIKMSIRQGTNEYRDILTKLNLYETSSFTKFIPEIYFNSSEDIRYELLSGLLDTDGTVNKLTGAISFTTTSISLASDIQKLVWSLGGKAKIKLNKPKKFAHKGIKKEGATSYEVAIRHPNPEKLFKLTRKGSLVPDKYQYSDSLRNEISSVSYAGEHEAQCIMVDHPDHLYITDDYIVTHNTAIAEGLALKIVRKEVPEVIEDCTVYSLDIGSLIAGTRFRGDFEERMKKVLLALEIIPKSILFIDEIHTVLGAGSGNESSLDVANLLKPALAKGDLRCIGSTTLEEYRKHIEKDRALNRRFKKVDIDEPTVSDAKLIIRGLAPYYEEFHKVKFTDEALDAAVELTSKFVTTAFLPDKAIDIIDQAGSRQKVAKPEDRKIEIGLAEIEVEVAKVAHIPAKTVSEDEQDKISHLEENLNKNVMGQPHALSTLSDAIYIQRAGLREKNKPAGCYLFSGPTGVGKTETARTLAKTLGVTLLKYDMSDYMEKHSISKLIGAPPGYVGYGEGDSGSGKLTNEVLTHPRAVVLLDEIEKAHPEIFNIFLQVMDDGQLVNASGKTVSFRNVILIMTTNAGASDSERKSIGFGSTDKSKSVVDEAIKKAFTPEFRNRLDAIVQFSKLQQEDILRIVRKFINQLETMALERKVSIDIDNESLDWLAKTGFDPLYGARPLERVIAEHVKTPLARLMISGPLLHGGTAKVRLVDKKIMVFV